MRLLDRYLFRELLLPLTYCVGGFIVCFIVFDLFGQIGEFQRNGLTGGDIFDYYTGRLPELVVSSYIMPMGLLLALLYALTNHARHNEITAMRAAGLSLLRICVPYFVVGIVFSIIVLVLNEQVVPDASDAAERVLYRHAANQTKVVEKLWKRNVFFVNPVDNRVWQIAAYNVQTRVMIGPHIDWRSRGGARTNIFAERGRWINRHWVLTNVQEFVYASPTTDIPEKHTIPEITLPRMLETPRLIQSEIKINNIETLRSLRKSQLSAGGILDYLRLHPTVEPRKRDSLLTLLHSRLAAPWTCFVVVLIAVPFGALPGRRNVFVGVASSIAICFIYFIAKDLTLALGSGGYVPAWVAAWAPNAVFAAVGVFLMWRIR